MFMSESKEGLSNLTQINHNEKRDPHSQYNRFISYNCKPDALGSATNLIFKIFDTDIQLNPSLMANSYDIRNGGLKLSFYYDSSWTNKRYFEFGICTIRAVFDDAGVLTPFLSSTDLGKNNRIKFNLYYKLNTANTTTTEYNLKLYISVPNNYMNISISPFFFDTVTVSGNNYAALYNTVRPNKKERIDALLEDFTNASAISSTIMSTNTQGYKIALNSGERVTSAYTSGTIIDATNVYMISLGATVNGQTLNKIINGINEQEITIVSWNEYTTLTSIAWNNGVITADSMLLKDETSVVIPRGKTLTLKYMYSAWFEIGRSF